MAVNRFLPLSGVVFVALWVLVLLIGGDDTPSTGDPGTEIASFYADESVRQGVSAFLIAATVPFLVFFAVSLAAVGWADAEARTLWRWVLLGGSFITGAVLMMIALVHFALADGGDQGLAPAAMEALNGLDGNFWVAANAALGVMMLGAAGWLLGRERTWGWLGWAALVFGIALFIPFVDFFALLLSLVWIVVASVMLYREPEVERRAVVAPA
jgi:hypothetical protein